MSGRRQAAGGRRQAAGGRRQAAGGRLLALWALLVAAPLQAAIIDRIAIVAGNQVITESQIDEEVRLTAFLNREPVDLSSAARKQAASRLVEQALVKREMDLSAYPLPALDEADVSLRAVKAMYPDEQRYQDALRTYGISEDALKRRLWWQLTLLRFIDYRFRPGIQISDAEVQAYYQQQSAELQRQGKPPMPTLEDSRDQIVEILTQQGIDQALDRWLADSRTQVAIQYHDEAIR